MLSVVFGLVITTLFAFAYRARGGAIPLNSTTLARVVFWGVPVAIVMTIIAVVAGFPWWLGLISGAIAFGLEVIGHGFAQNNDPNAEAEMGLVVVTDLLGIFLPFAFFSHVLPFLALIGILAWPLSRMSYLSWFTNQSLTLFGIQWCRVPAVGGSEWEELFIGAVCGLTFSIALALVM